MGRSSTAASNSAEEWEGRPVLARALRVVLSLLPFAAALAVSYLLSNSWQRPSGWAVVVWLVAITLVSFATMVAVDRMTRRLVPLTVLLRMALVFPDRAPSRFSVAMRSASTRELDRAVERVKADGLGENVDDAAETLLLMVSALTKHDRMTRGHSERTRAYSDLIAEEMGLTKQERSKLRWAALLHDVGKVYVPARILNHPGELTDREHEIVRTHTSHGARMIEPLREWLGEWADTVGQHHERWDGGGYPNGIAGTRISRGARIVAVADTFDVVTSVRSYKKAQPASYARAEIAANSGTQFDPDVVRAFLSVGLGRFRFEMGPLTLLAQLPALRFLLEVGRATATVTTSGAGIAAPTAAAAISITGLMAPFAAPASSALPPAELAFVEATTIEEVQRVTIPSKSIRTDTSDGPESQTTTTPGSSISIPDSSSESSSTTTSTGRTATSTTTAATSTTAAPATTNGSTTTTTVQPTTTSRPTTTTVAPRVWPSGIEAIANCLDEPVDLAAWRMRDGLDLSECNFDGLDFADTDLSKIGFLGGSYVGADFQRSNLTDSNFASANLASIDLRNSSLTATDFGNVGLDGADLRNASFDGTHFHNFSAVGADFSSTGGSSAPFIDVHFSDGKLDNAHISKRVAGGLLIEGSVTAVGVDFSRTTLSGGRLNGVDLSNSDFSNGSSTGTRYENAILVGVDFSGHFIRGTKFDGSTIIDTEFFRSDIAGTSFAATSLDTVTFFRAKGSLDLSTVNMIGPVTCQNGQTYTSPPPQGLCT